MRKLQNILINKNFILLTALLLAFIVPEGAGYIKKHTVWLVVLIMMFSTTTMSFKFLLNFKYVARVTLISVFMNYFIFGAVLMFVAHFFLTDEALLAGFLVIAVAPPGILAIPFSSIYKSDIRFALTGVLGSHFVSILLTPFLLSVFSTKEIPIQPLIWLVLQITILPLALSRLLRFKKGQEFSEKYKGHISNIAFALIVYTAVGVNKELILADLNLLLNLSLIIGGVMFVLGTAFMIVTQRMPDDKKISYNLVLTIKNTGFSIATAFALFEEKTSLPAAILCIFVVLYLLSVNVLQSFFVKKEIR